MLDEGTPGHSWRDIADWVDGCGGNLDAFGTREASGISLKVLKEDLPAGLDLVRELLYESAFPPDRLELTRSQVLTHIAAREDRPDYLGAREFNRVIYDGTSLAHPTFGYRDTVRGFRREQLREFHARWYHPANTVLVAVGDLDSGLFLDAVEKGWGGLPAGERPVRQTLALHRQTEPFHRRVPVKDREQLHIYLGHLGIRRNHPDFYRLLVMDVILGAGPGFTARIPHRIRDEMGLAYHTYASICSNAGLDEGRFTAYLGTSPRHRDLAVAEILHEIRRIREEPVTAEELAGAKDYLTGSFVFHFETMGLIANFILSAWLYGLGFDYPEKFYEYIRKVSAADVQAVAWRHLDPDCVTMVEVMPETGRGAPRR
jgi:zinc protease